MLPAQADNAVPFGVPARFLLTGVVALALACTTLALRPQLLLGSYAAPTLLAVVHGLTLGFATMILVGALHQLMPVLLVTRLHSAKLGTLTYGLLLPGVVAVVTGFASGYRVTLLATGGGLVLAGLLLFDYNLWRTANSATTRDAVGRTMLASAGYLTLTVLMGLLIALGRVFPLLAEALGYVTPLHLGLGLFGAFFLAIAGAGHKLLAMFVLAHDVAQARLNTLLWLVHGALLSLVVHTFSGLFVWPLALLLLIAATGLFALDIWAILAKRMRRQLELPIRHYLLAPGFLLLALALGIFGHYPAAVFSLLGGFITLAIAGMLIKIASFLTWQHRYAARVGKEKVPMLRDMSLEVLSRVSFWSFGLGALLITLALVRPSAVLATVGSLLLALAAWGLLGHVLWIVLGRHRPQAVGRSSRQAA